MYRASVVAGLLFSLFAPFASAEAIEGSNFEEAGWGGGAYNNDSTGEFSHCAISAEYKSGMTLIFSVNRYAVVSVSLGAPGADLDKDETFSVRLKVDNRKEFFADAIAVTKEQVILSLPDLDAALAAFKKGRTLRIESGTFSQDFDLSGTFRALDRVMQCAIYYYNNYVPSDRAPVALSAKSDPAPAIDKTLLFQVSTAMISEAGASDFRYLSDDELAELGLPNAVVWRSPSLGLTGGVVLRDAGASPDLRAESAAAARDLTLTCEGDAAVSTREVKWADFGGREVRMVCVSGDSSSEAYRNLVLIDAIILETFSVFEGDAQPAQGGKSHQELNEAISLQAAKYVAEK